jgi:hypothetical protein
MLHTTPPKVDKVDTPSAEPPTAQGLVARSESKMPDGDPADDDPDLLNFTVVVSWIAYWPDLGKPDGLVWETGWSGFHAP